MKHYDSSRLRPAFIEEFFALIQYRELLFEMTRNVLRHRYRRSMLGVLWMLLNPLLQTAVLAFAFSFVFQAKLPNYPMYVLSGLLAWHMLTQPVSHAMGTMAFGAALLGRVYMPPTVFPCASVGNGVFNAVITLVAIAGVALLLGHPITTSWLLLPVSLLLNAMFCLGVSLLLSTAAAYFTDSVEIWGIVSSALFFLCPIVYPVDVLKPELMQLVQLNPFYYFIGISHDLIYFNVLPDAFRWSMAALLAVLTLGVGWVCFTTASRGFAYRA